MAGIDIASQVETDALILQITRLTAFQDRVRCVLDEASAACAIFDTLDAGSTKYADLLVDIKPLLNNALCALPAIVECEERAVEFDGALERLMEVSGTEQNAACPAGSAQSALAIASSQALRGKPLLLATAVVTKLANLLFIAHAIAHCPAEIESCLEKALEKKDMLGLALLLKHGRVQVSETHGLCIIKTAIQAGHTDILVQLKNYFKVSSNTRKAAEILLIDDTNLRQAAFEAYVHAVFSCAELAEPTSRVNHILALLASTLVNPGAASYDLLDYFVRTHATSAVRALLAHPQLDPSVDGIMAVVMMARETKGSAELKHLLVNYASAHPAMDAYSVLGEAISCEDLVNTRKLLADPRINLTGHVRFLNRAIQTGSVDVVAVLLSDRHVNPAANDNYALHLARRMENKPIIALLLTDERVKRRDELP